ncbi:ABC transporter substrate-binding protein [Streptomyces sp. NPDC048623]|uniref:ABC transporter substrate-binding protein n=1 Tax=Streptomyces sp. NPDC048623 TaxID=3155761 RepID=UPI00341EFDAC
MTDDQLRTVTRTQGNNQALKTGAVRPHGFSFDFEEVPVLVHAFRRMVREHAYDISEMALTTYLVAKEHGARFTAVPAFLVRGFHHGAIHHHTGAPVTDPKDLEGRRVGVSRGYTVTTGVWARSVLQEEYGVDLSKVTWVLSGDEHVADYTPPGNVESLKPGRTLEEALVAGDLAAAIGIRPESEQLVPLLPDAEQAGYRALTERGLFPINHLVVVRDELLDRNPELAAQVFDAFARSKQRYVERLRAGEGDTATDAMHRRVMRLTGADPLPYGIEPNRGVLEALLRHAVDQRILSRPRPLEELFAPAARDLVG